MAQAQGWYEDGSGSLRWWDGAAWTEHVKPVPQPQSQPQPQAQTQGYPQGQPQPFAQGQQQPYPQGQPQPFAHGVPYPQAAAAFPGTGAPPSSARRRATRGQVVGRVVAVVLGAAVLITGGVVLFRSLVMGPQIAVEGFNNAYMEVDCHGMQDVVATDFFAGVFVDCAGFDEVATSLLAELEGGAEGFGFAITSTERVDDEATVVARETYRWTDGTERVDVVTYSLQKVGDTWEIWDVVYDEG
ncbi:hypothetical protein C8046_09025 [Serinibacter arcticus]|uniref:DUF2510 domain-containing protein n=1 Tax=Serinibacter arcticus TaxID=1655435 RepID=A0A2U1ZUV5_9MICO|nr:DUF2510 domain-containing protein [Serinibacter arcticus]PWD50766.1 hypothetical protein C8046_09025 [Serinibacter arcticus]